MRSRRPPVYRERAGGAVVLVLILGLTFLAGAGYAAAYLLAGDKIARATTVAGVPIGGRTPQQAVGVLRDALATRSDRPLTVLVNGQSRRFRPQAFGLHVDYVASVAGARAQQSWQFSRLWNYYTGGEDLPAVVSVDKLSMNRLVHQLSQSAGSPAVDGGVDFVGDHVVVTHAVPGLEVDARQARRALRTTYLSGTSALTLMLQRTDPAIDDTDVQRFVSRFANPAVSGPVTLRFGERSVHLQPSQFAPVLRARPAGGRLVPAVDRQALDRMLATVVRTDSGAQDASITIAGGQPQIVRDRPAVSMRPEDAATALLRVVRRDAGNTRTVRVPASLSLARFTARDARRLKVREPVGRFSVPAVGARAGGAMRAARRLDETLLRPGDSLSLNGALGRAGSGDDAEVATALFNAAYLGGLDVVQRSAHPSYGGGFPVGRDAVAGTDGDLTVRNSTPYGVLVQSTWSPRRHGGSVQVTLWSTRRWRVSLSTSAPTNVVPAGHHDRLGRACTPRTGRRGFDVVVTRSFRKPGDPAVARSDSVATHYAPVAAVTCHALR